MQRAEVGVLHMFFLSQVHKCIVLSVAGLLNTSESGGCEDELASQRSPTPRSIKEQAELRGKEVLKAPNKRAKRPFSQAAMEFLRN